MVNPFLTEGQVAASLAQQFLDEEKASLMAYARMGTGYLADFGKSFDELKADALVEIQAKRVREAAHKRTVARLADAEREGTQAALAEHAAKVQPAPAAPQPAAHQPEQVKPESIPERDYRWLEVWDKESPSHASGSQVKAIAHIVNTEGVNADTVKKGLQRAKKARQEAHREGVVRLPGQKKALKKTPATPFSGLARGG